MSNPLEEFERRLRSGVTSEDQKKFEMAEKQREEKELAKQRYEYEVALRIKRSNLLSCEQEFQTLEAVTILARQMGRERFVSRIAPEDKAEIKYIIVLAKYQGLELILKDTGRRKMEWNSSGGGVNAWGSAGEWYEAPIYKAVGTKPIELEDKMEISLDSDSDGELRSIFSLSAYGEAQAPERDLLVIPRTFTYHSQISLCYEWDNFLKFYGSADKMGSTKQSFYGHLENLHKVWREDYSKWNPGKRPVRK